MSKMTAIQPGDQECGHDKTLLLIDEPVLFRTPPIPYQLAENGEEELHHE